MAKADAVFGGEHSAHYYFRDFWFADTGMLAALHVLAALGEQDGPLSGLVAEYERYTASGEINSVVSSVAQARYALMASSRSPNFSVAPASQRCGATISGLMGWPTSSTDGSPASLPTC